MKQNSIQFQKGLSLATVLDNYGNVKNSLAGTYHAINKKHLPRYLAEFCFRFNRRFKLETMIPRLGYAAVRTPPMPFRFLKMAEAH